MAFESDMRETLTITMDSSIQSFFDEQFDVEFMAGFMAPPSTPVEDRPQTIEVVSDKSGAVTAVSSSIPGVGGAVTAVSSSIPGVGGGETAVSRTPTVATGKVRKRKPKGAARVPRHERVWHSCHVCGHRNHNRRLFCAMCYSSRRTN